MFCQFSPLGSCHFFQRLHESPVVVDRILLRIGVLDTLWQSAQVCQYTPQRWDDPERRRRRRKGVCAERAFDHHADNLRALLDREFFHTPYIMTLMLECRAIKHFTFLNARHDPIW